MDEAFAAVVEEMGSPALSTILDMDMRMHQSHVRMLQGADAEAETVSMLDEVQVWKHKLVGLKREGKF